MRAELEVVIDTDVPLFSQVGALETANTTVRIDRLRIDVFDEAGTGWLDSRDFHVGAPTNWPVTFGVRSQPDDTAKAFRLRIRIYPAGRTEAQVELDAAGDVVPLIGPRGLPVLEPVPAFTVDRVVMARLEPSVRQRIGVMLHGDCMGIVADVPQAMSCVQAGDSPTSVVVGDAPLQEAGPLPASQVGRWSRAKGQSCSTTPRTPTVGLFDEQVCVPGGVFHLGDDRVFITKDCDFTKDICEAYPERFVALSPFYIDRFQVTVARYRAARKHPTNPFIPPDIILNEPVLYLASQWPTVSEYCTWTGLEPTQLPGYDYDPADDARPINCITQAAARAFCQWDGGDLPTEAQWEYVATAARRPFKTLYPWGDELPECAGVVFGRGSSELGGYQECVDAGFPSGIAAVDEVLGASLRDETAPFEPAATGVVGLAGLVADVLRDGAFPYDAPCWQHAPMLDPVCDYVGAERLSARGGSFRLPKSIAMAANRRSLGRDLFSYDVGFRCVRSAGGAR